MITQSTTRSQALNQFVQFKKQAASSQPKTFNMPSDRELDIHMERLHTVLFAKNMTPQVRNAMIMLAKSFTFMIPYYDIYKQYVLTNEITIKQIAEAYSETNWNELPPSIKNKVVRSAERLQRRHKAYFEEMTTLIKRQADHVDGLTDGEAEMILDFEPSELEKVHTEINSYITAAEADDKYLMTPKQIAAYLAVQSKGMIYLTPSEVTHELTNRKFKKSQYSTAFFVKTI